jgi:hypothetical protein
MKTIGILLVILLATAPMAAADITIVESISLGASDDEEKAGIYTVCIDGQKFVFAYKWAAKGTIRGVGAGGGVSFIQVYEEKAGNVVPAKCD